MSAPTNRKKNPLKKSTAYSLGTTAVEGVYRGGEYDAGREKCNEGECVVQGSMKKGVWCRAGCGYICGVGKGKCIGDSLVQWYEGRGVVCCRVRVHGGILCGAEEWGVA